MWLRLTRLDEGPIGVELRRRWEFHWDPDTGRFSQGTVLRLGRQHDCDVQLHPEEDLEVSGYHAELHVRDGKMALLDRSSRNGTWLDGVRIRSTWLVDGVEIELGHGGPRLQVELGDDGNPELA